jgi:hypothetical protein
MFIRIVTYLLLSRKLSICGGATVSARISMGRLYRSHMYEASGLLLMILKLTFSSTVFYAEPHYQFQVLRG